MKSCARALQNLEKAETFCQYYMIKNDFGTSKTLHQQRWVINQRWVQADGSVDRARVGKKDNLLYSTN